MYKLASHHHLVEKKLDEKKKMKNLKRGISSTDENSMNFFLLLVPVEAFSTREN